MWETIRENRRRTLFLAALMALLLMLTGYFAVEMLEPGAGAFGVFLAVCLWIFLSTVTWFQGDNILLAVSGAREIQRNDHPVLFNVVEEMTIASGLGKMPRIYIMDEEAPNAFAVGRSSSSTAVAVTKGLLSRLDRDELQGVIAHELSHIKNRDVLLMVMVGVMMGAIVIIADIAMRTMFYRSPRSRSSSRKGNEAQLVIMLIGLILIIVAPLLAELIYFAISRKREYLADACGAQFTRYPEGLARALEKISSSSIKLKSASKATAPMYIANPLSVTARGLSNLTSTHPPISERIKILRAMGGGSYKEYDQAYKKITGRPIGVIPFSALAQKEDVAAAEIRKVDTRTSVDRMRSATDVLWRISGYTTIVCACGTKLKIPPALANKKITCPHCGKIHEVSSNRN